MTAQTIAMSDFVKRQTEESPYSHFEGTDAALLDLVRDAWDAQKTGYRDGVILVPVAPEGFFSSTVRLSEGDALTGVFESRQVGEEPRKHVFAEPRAKMPAVAVDIVLYRADVLAEGDERSTDAEWEVVSINAHTTKGEEPMPPGTMMANHFQASGGTATGMTPEEFEKALRESFFYWKDKAKARPC